MPTIVVTGDTQASPAAWLSAGGAGRRLHARRGFTLVELLVVIAIVGVLVALLLPALQSTRERGRRLTCANNLKQLALGLLTYHDANAKFPAAFKPSTAWASGTSPASGQYGYGISWVGYVLPFIEQSALAAKVTFSIEGITNTSDPNWTLTVDNRLKELLCPSQSAESDIRESGFTPPRPNTMNYYGIMGVIVPTGTFFSATYPNYSVTAGNGQSLGSQGVFRVTAWQKQRGSAARDITDGLSKTYLLGEIAWAGIGASQTSNTRSYLQGYNPANGVYVAPVRNIFYGRPINIQKYQLQAGFAYTSDNGWNNLNWGSNHDRGTHFAMADGSVDFVDETIDMNVFMAGGSMNCGE